MSSRRRRPAAAAAATLLAVATTACGTPSGAPSTVVDPAVGGLEATLQDDIRDVAGANIAWSTFWTLCWNAYPGAVTYEVETVTAEGPSSKLQRQRGRCVRVEAAGGRNLESKGLRGRDVLLRLQASQLAYRVRAVLEEEKFSKWSERASVGAALGEG